MPIDIAKSKCKDLKVFNLNHNLYLLYAEKL